MHRRERMGYRLEIFVKNSQLALYRSGNRASCAELNPLSGIKMKTNKLLRKLLLLITISLIILITFFFVKNKSKLPKLVSAKLAKTGIDVSIKNLHLIEEKNGTKQWELNADIAEVINSKGITKLKEIQINLFQKNGEDILISADNGIIQNNNKNIELKGNVEVINHEGYTLKTENLKWFSEKKTIRIDSDVEISGTDINITGKEMAVDVENEIAEIYGNVRVLYYGMK